MNILQDVKTVKNLQLLTAQLDAIILDLSGKAHVKTEEAVREKSPEFSAPILHFLKEKDVSGKAEVAKELRSLKDSLNTARTLELVIAVAPTEDLVNEVFGWVYKNVGKDIVIELKTDPAVVGGAALTFEGKYVDYSLSKKLKQVFVQIKKGGEPQ